MGASSPSGSLPPPRAHAELVEDLASGGMEYRIAEPPLTVEDRRLLVAVRRRLFDVGLEVPQGAADGAARLRERLNALARSESRLRDPSVRERLLYYLVRDLLGFGPIDVAMRDPEVEDISCDGVGVPIFVHHRARGSVRTNVAFASSEALDRYVVWLAQRSGRHLSIAEPLLEATLPGGARLEASLGYQVTTRGSTFTIRRFRERGYTPVDLVRLGTMSAEMMAYLWLSVDAGQSFMVCGGTASGKTTTLNAILRFVPSGRKIVSIEDTRELDLAQENWVPLRTRGSSAGREGSSGPPSGPVDMFDLLSTALRQRPQFLVVGEVRGREAYTVFQAIATGKTCATTFHAESVRAMVQRMESAPIEIPRALIAALPLVILERQVRVGDAPARRVQSIVEITGLDPETDELVASTIFSWDPARDRFEFTGQSRLVDRLADERRTGRVAVERELDRRRELIERWAARSEAAGDGEELARRLAAYARDPEAVLETARIGSRAAWVPAVPAQ